LQIEFSNGKLLTSNIFKPQKYIEYKKEGNRIVGSFRNYKYFVVIKDDNLKVKNGIFYPFNILYSLATKQFLLYMGIILFVIILLFTMLKLKIKN